MRAIVSICCAALATTAFAAPNGIAALLTDYGADSIYVGVLKGAMISKNAAVRVETITNSVPNYDVVAGAYILAEACKQWPAGTAFCCVVDPGVGTPRKPIALETKSGQYFVGPDNGLLSLVAKRFGVASLHELQNAKYFGPNAVSSTFQGRDIFGPVTAAIAGGAPLDDLGPALEKLVELDFPEAKVEGGTIHGAVIRADGYGNLVTNIPAELMGQAGIHKGDEVDITLGKAQYTAPYKNTYGEVPVGTRLLCSQSIGMVEAAINQGDLAATLNEGLHAAVVLKKTATAATERREEKKAEETADAGLYFSRSGGFAGDIDELTLAADGKCHLKSRRKGTQDFSITKEDVARIEELAKKAFEAKPEDPNGPRAGGADYLSYIVRYDGKEKRYNDLNAPEAFKELTRALNEVIAKHAQAVR